MTECRLLAGRSSEKSSRKQSFIIGDSQKSRIGIKTYMWLISNDNVRDMELPDSRINSVSHFDPKEKGNETRRKRTERLRESKGSLSLIKTGH